MISRSRILAVLVPFLACSLAAVGSVCAQLGPGAGLPLNSPAGQYGSGYGLGSGLLSSGYGVRNGQLGAGYQSAGRLYQQGFPAPRPQTTIALQPLYSLITSVPGWYGPAQHRRARRLHAQQSPPSTPPYDDHGKVLWPSTIPDDPAAAALRRSAEEAVGAVVREYKDTGHGSVRPVIDAKKKLSAFERKVLPAVKAKNVTDGAALETFFFDLDKALDNLTYTY